MAIFNSYVKLPEGMKHVCSSRIRGLFKLIERLFNAGISGRQRFWSVMAQKSKNTVMSTTDQ